MSKVAPVFPLATGAVDPLKAAFEKAGKGDSRCCGPARPARWRARKTRAR